MCTTGKNEEETTFEPNTITVVVRCPNHKAINADEETFVKLIQYYRMSLRTLHMEEVGNFLLRKCQKQIINLSLTNNFKYSDFGKNFADDLCTNKRPNRSSESYWLIFPIQTHAKLLFCILVPTAPGP
jgi:hypothetical protein